MVENGNLSQIKDLNYDLAERAGNMGLAKLVRNLGIRMLMFKSACNQNRIPVYRLIFIKFNIRKKVIESFRAICN